MTTQIIEFKSISINFNQQYGCYELVQKMFIGSRIREVGTLSHCLGNAARFLSDDDNTTTNRQLLADMHKAL